MAWGLAHGLSALMVGGHLTSFAAMAPPERDAAIAAILRRVRP